MPKISVIIPTYNRADVLRRTLNLLSLQTLDRRAFEVIVVDDGSSDDTPRTLQEWQAKNVLHLRTFRQDNAGAGAARNRALDAAQGEIMVMLGDDMLPTPGCLEAHFRFHIHNGKPTEVALGKVDWSPELTVTPFMHWLTTSGVQFKFDDLRVGQQTDFRRFYTANISIKSAFLGSERFDPRFHGWGFEDTELGYRLSKKGMQLKYFPEALVHHYHPMTDEKLLDRMRSAGHNAVLFESIHPEAHIIPGGMKRLMQKLVATLLPWTWYGKTKKGFLTGIDEALQSLEKNRGFC